jgi:hypothetical protein
MIQAGHDEPLAGDEWVPSPMPPASDESPADDPAADLPAKAPRPDWETDLKRSVMAAVVAVYIYGGLNSLVNKPTPLKVVLLVYFAILLIGMLLCRVIRVVRRQPRGG